MVGLAKAYESNNFFKLARFLDEVLREACFLTGTPVKRFCIRMVAPTGWEAEVQLAQLNEM